jgi:hypothetical protein
MAIDFAHRQAVIGMDEAPVVVGASSPSEVPGVRRAPSSRFLLPDD